MRFHCIFSDSAHSKSLRLKHLNFSIFSGHDKAYLCRSVILMQGDLLPTSAFYGRGYHVAALFFAARAMKGILACAA